MRNAVERAAAEPPPLPFPWGWFTLAPVATFVAALSGLWLLQPLALSSVVAALAGIGPELGYALATILATLALQYTPQLRLARRRLALPRGAAPWTAPRA